MTSPPWPAGTATGIGSLPGADIVEATRMVFGELPDLPHVPELPGRGKTAGMVARTGTMLVDLHVDLQPSGWRLVAGEGMDERRARSLLARDLDAVEEVAQGYAGPLKLQVAGPFTLASGVGRPRGDLVLGDYGARRDLADSLTEGIGTHIGEIRRRVPGAHVVVQVDEPALPAVLDGAVPTASGFSRHRAVEEYEARATLGTLFEAVVAASAVPVVHTCGDRTLVELFASAGAAGVSFDASKVTESTYDVLSTVVEQGVVLMVGAVPAVDPGGTPLTDADVTKTVLRLWQALGFTEDSAATGCVVTPACGLAGASPTWARTALSLAKRAAANLRQDESG